MNINKKILVHSLDVGYMVTDYISGKRYAKETAEGVIEVLRAIFSAEKLDQKEPDTPKVEAPSPVSSQVLEEPTMVVLEVLRESLLIPRFKYDPAQKKEIEGYTNLSVVEMPDGRAVIQYKGTHYYTTKEKVMQQIPYPTPCRYFKGFGISATAQTCIRAYRQYLHFASVQEKEKPTGSEDGACDDITFESCANNSPENCKFCVDESRFENKNKLAARKPAPPLMRASVPP